MAIDQSRLTAQPFRTNSAAAFGDFAGKSLAVETRDLGGGIARPKANPAAIRDQRRGPMSLWFLSRSSLTTTALKTACNLPSQTADSA